MDLQLSGKTAIVTGASRGIGLAIAEALATEGVSVMAAARESSPELAALVQRLPVRSVPADLATPEGPARVVDEAVRTLGGLDLLVNNVGATHTRPGGFLTVTDDDWAAALTLNFLAAVRTTRAALPHLLDRQGGVVTVASVNARLPDPLVIDYSAAKAALLNFSKALSKEVGPRGVRLNTVSPGPVSTDLWLGAGGVAATVAQAHGGDPADVAKAAAGQSPTDRFTRPQEVADLVVLLASGRLGNVTGADFVIDGGLISTI
jgi:NAD(P)-dependent dehydrogenase (short-subunit alcohol dehydrogenase family)